MVKPGFHVIATIAMIAEKKKFSDHMETTLQRSQRKRSMRLLSLPLLESGFI